jgi:predicted alpha/beta hydrolase
MEPTQEWVDRGTDRLGLHVYPTLDGGRPLAVVWPAMGVPARYYRPFASSLAAAGLAVAVVDLRGTGTSTPRPSRASRYRYADLVADVGAVLAHLKGDRVLLIGHSLGGQACALHLATSQSNVAGLVLVAAGLPYWRDYPAGWRTTLPMTQGINVVSTVLGVWPGWGFGGRQSRGLIRDWAYTARTGRFPLLEQDLAGISTPVLAVSVENDQYTPPSTLDRLCAKLRAAPIERSHYTSAEAGGPLDHFIWVRAADPLATRIATFAATL